MRKIEAVLAAFALAALAACASQQTSSVGGSVAQPQPNVTRAAPPPDREAQPPATSIQNAPPGTSVYRSSTYNQPGYSYPAGTQ
jgi:hypothetical protein